MVLIVLMLFHSMSLTGRIGFDMFSNPDKGQLYVKLEYPTDYDLERTVARVRKPRKGKAAAAVSAPEAVAVDTDHEETDEE